MAGGRHGSRHAFLGQFLFPQNTSIFNYHIQCYNGINKLQEGKGREETDGTMTGKGITRFSPSTRSSRYSHHLHGGKGDAMCSHVFRRRERGQEEKPLHRSPGAAAPCKMGEEEFLQRQGKFCHTAQVRV